MEIVLKAISLDILRFRAKTMPQIKEKRQGCKIGIHSRGKGLTNSIFILKVLFLYSMIISFVLFRSFRKIFSQVLERDKNIRVIIVGNEKTSPDLSIMMSITCPVNPSFHQMLYIYTAQQPKYQVIISNVFNWWVTYSEKKRLK